MSARMFGSATQDGFEVLETLSLRRGALGSRIAGRRARGTMAPGNECRDDSLFEAGGLRGLPTPPTRAS